MNYKFIFFLFLSIIIFIFIIIYKSKYLFIQQPIINEYSGYYLKNKNEVIDKINLNEINKRQFFEKYVIKRKPVLFSTSIKGKFNNWNNNYLKKIIGKNDVHVLVKGNTYVNPKRKIIKFNDFINHIENGYNKYYLNVQEYENNESYLISPILKKLYKLKEFPMIPNILGNIIPYQINIWIGGDNTKSKIHHDYHDNLYIVIKGKKIIKLYSPIDAENLYLNGNISKIRKNGIIEYSDLIRNDVHFSKIDFEKKKSEIIKKYNKYIYAKETICEINEGEMLYIPCGWFHEVTSYNNENTNENHIAISYWCHPPDLLNKESFDYPYSDKYLKYDFEKKLYNLEQKLK